MIKDKRRLDKLPYNLTIVSSIIDKQLELGLKYNLSLVSTRDLLTVIRHYLKFKTPISSYSILSKTNTAGSTYNRLYQRIKLMLDKGLVLNTNESDNKFLLIPTDKAIKEFKELFNCID